MVQISHRYGMILFIASEVMFFVAWFWAYFNAALFPGDAHAGRARPQLIGGVWPPKGIETFDPWHLPLLNTLILLTSGTTVTWAHHALLEDDRQGLKWGLILTILLGAHLHLRAGLRIQRTPPSASAATSTAPPSSWRPASTASMCIIGTIFLIVCLIRAYGRPLHAEAASRLRIRRLVLALRRRGVAVPVRLHLCLGRRCAASAQ